MFSVVIGVVLGESRAIMGSLGASEPSFRTCEIWLGAPWRTGYCVEN